MKPRRLDNDHRRNNDKEKEIITDVDSQVNCSNNKYIPIEVTAEILSRLPIKSIGRFVSVSKSWRDAITGRRFSSLHAKNNPFSTFYNITTRWIYYSHSDHYAFEVDEDGNSATTTFRPRIEVPSEGLLFAGSCNGLLCLLESRSGSDAITILNPITNEKTVATLPKHKYCPRGLSEVDCCLVAESHKFCYSPSTYEYKVFKHVLFLYRRFRLRGAFAIFTVGVDRRWRELSPLLFSDELLCNGDAVFCDGALHWLVYRGDPNSNHVVAFDIARESTRRMPIRKGIELHTALTVFDNRVCLYGHHSERADQSGNVVWNSVEAEGSWWSQVLPPTISSVPDPGKGYEEEEFEPLDCATKYGGVLLAGVKYGHSWLYCPKQERLTDIGVARVPGGRLVELRPTFSSIEEILHRKSSDA